MQLSALSQRTGGEERARLDEAVDHTTLALSSLRRLAHGVVPPLLDDAGLFEAITSLAEQTDVPLVLDVELDHQYDVLDLRSNALLTAS